jgi:hypothetical protein
VRGFFWERITVLRMDWRLQLSAAPFTDLKIVLPFLKSLISTLASHSQVFYNQETIK